MFRRKLCCEVHIVFESENNRASSPLSSVRFSVPTSCPSNALTESESKRPDGRTNGQTNGQTEKLVVEVLWQLQQQTHTKRIHKADCISEAILLLHGQKRHFLLQTTFSSRIFPRSKNSSN